MMLDTSAPVAILRAEPEGAAFHALISAASLRRPSAPTAVEASISMLSRFGKEGLDALNALLIAFAIDIVPLSDTHRHTAIDGFWRYGKGRNPAALNFGGCFSYALAKATG